MNTLAQEIQKFLKGDIAFDEKTLAIYSRDASLFEVKPKIVVFPKDAEDIKKLVQFVSDKKKEMSDISLTVRAGGTDMSGGPLNDSIIVDVIRYLNHIKDIGDLRDGEGYVVAEPGVFYRDFEKETLKRGYILPTYPASRELCALGGMVANNAGGEKTLVYGKTENFVMELSMILSDGKEYVFKPLSNEELTGKMQQKDLEGDIYRQIYKLIDENFEIVKKAKPGVSKNSAGLNLWDIWDKNFFDLTKLIVGAQGILGIVTSVKFRLVKPKTHSGMAVIFLKDFNHLTDLIQKILPLGPASFESFDNYTLRLAIRFFPSFLKLLGAKNIFALAFRFLPELWLVLTMGMPKMVLLVEFEEENETLINRKINELLREIGQFKVKTRVARTAEEMKKYWAIRRESFNLLRQRIRGKQTAPFIDDVIVRPEYLPEFLPKLYEILDRYNLLYTIAGHVGDGNFHVIPLMELAKEEERKKIEAAAAEVYSWVFKFGGSTTAEHNDGLIRSHYLKEMYGERIYKLFEEVKRIFDSSNIFNPRKKIGADFKFALEHIKRS